MILWQSFSTACNQWTVHLYVCNSALLSFTNPIFMMRDYGYTHIRGEPKLVYDTPDEYSFAHEMIEEFVFSKK